MPELARLVETGSVAATEPTSVTLTDARAVASTLDLEQPIFLFSETELRSRLAQFKDGFPGLVSYAVKCNDSAEVLAALGRAGLQHYDVASVIEMDTVSSHVPGAQFHYHNPVKSRDEIARAYWRHSVRRFAVDDIGELVKIAAVLPSTNGVEIAVRFRLPKLTAANGDATAAHDFTTKFGATAAEAAELLKETVALGFTPVVTFHPGSQCLDPTAYRRHIEAAAGIAATAGVTLAALNVGGGFPAPYAGTRPIGLTEYFRIISEAARATFGANHPPLECEPGRGLVSTCMSVLTCVKAVRPRTSEVFLNDGIYGSLLEVSQAGSLRPVHRVIRRGAELVENLVLHTVYGPTCDPLDRLPHLCALPADIEEGDAIEFSGLGAYSKATTTRFNGYGAARVVCVETVLRA